MSDTTAETLESMGASWLTLYRDTYNDEVQDFQWMPGMTPVPRFDTTERSSGLTNDPTATTAMDARRIALREAVIQAERALQSAIVAMEKAGATLKAALHT